MNTKRQDKFNRIVGILDSFTPTTGELTDARKAVSKMGAYIRDGQPLKDVAAYGERLQEAFKPKTKAWAIVGCAVNVVTKDIETLQNGAAMLTPDNPTLHDYKTGRYIRKASPSEVAESRSSGAEGVILVDGKSCYVEE